MLPPLGPVVFEGSPTPEKIIAGIAGLDRIEAVAPGGLEASVVKPLA